MKNWFWEEGRFESRMQCLPPADQLPARTLRVLREKTEIPSDVAAEASRYATTKTQTPAEFAAKISHYQDAYVAIACGDNNVIRFLYRYHGDLPWERELFAQACSQCDAECRELRHKLEGKQEMFIRVALKSQERPIRQMALIEAWPCPTLDVDTSLYAYENAFASGNVVLLEWFEKHAQWSSLEERLLRRALWGPRLQPTVESKRPDSGKEAEQDQPHTAVQLHTEDDEPTAQPHSEAEPAEKNEAAEHTYSEEAERDETANPARDKQQDHAEALCESVCEHVLSDEAARQDDPPLDDSEEETSEDEEERAHDAPTSSTEPISVGKKHGFESHAELLVCEDS